MPMVSTMPAMPGSVSVKPKNDIRPDQHHEVGEQRKIGEDAEQPIGDDHEHEHADAGRSVEAMRPARIESEPRLGPTVRSSTMVSFAGRAPERSTMARSLASCTVKLPEI